MSNFSEQLRSIIKREDLSIYHLAKQLECDRSWLNKVISGERKMTFESFLALCNLLEQEVGGNFLKELYESFCESYFGDGDYASVCYIRQRFIAMHKLELYLERTKKTGFDFEQYCTLYQLNDHQRLIAGKVYDNLNKELEQAKQEQRLPVIHFNIPAEWEYLKDLFIIFMTVQDLKGNVDFKYIINSVGQKNRETAEVEQFLTATEFATYGYNTMEGDVILAQDIGLLLFPYHIMLGEQILMISADGIQAIVCENAEDCKLLINRFNKLCEQKTPFLLAVNPDSYSGILLAGKIDIRDTIEIGNNICVAAFYTKDILEKIIPKEFPDRSFIIETLNMYYGKSRSSNLTTVFSIESVKHFLETDEPKQEGQYYVLEFDKETKLEILQSIEAYYSNSDKEIAMLQTEFFRYLTDMHIFAWDERIIGTTGFLYVGEYKVDAMSFIQNPVVAKQIWKYDVYIRNSSFYLDKAGSLQVLNNLINAYTN